MTRLVLVCAFLCSALPVMAADQQVQVRPEATRPAQRVFDVDLELETPPGQVGNLPGLALRFCWSQADNVQLQGATAKTGAPDVNYPSIGTEDSLARCKADSRAVGVPMIWLAQNASWPGDAASVLATVQLAADEDFDGVIDLWVERIGSGPGIGLDGVSSFVEFLPDLIFEDSFGQ